MLAPVTEEMFDKSAELLDQLLKANKEARSLEALRQQARQVDSEFTVEDELLLYSGRLVVPGTGLRTAVIREAHDQVSTAHPGRDKTYKLLRPRYYWPNMIRDVERYVRNCHACRRADIPRDRTPGLLQPLPVPEHPWQHITMDFKSMPKDEKGFDTVFVVIDRLSKQSIFTPCFKTTTAEDMARMFIDKVYRYYGLL